MSAGSLSDPGRRPSARFELPSSLSMLTDLYQLTMAYGYCNSSRADVEAVFHMSFRSSPFGGGYALACGLEPVIDYLSTIRFGSEDTGWLARQQGNDGRPLFDDDFLAWLEAFRFSCDVDAVPEGTVVFPREPLMRVKGPIAQAQLIETTVLNLLNFSTLVATKASRCVFAAEGQPVVEFGLRRAQGPDGGFTASRAAYVGGCVGTSNALAGRLLGIPAKGTHAHSWVMAFDSEQDAFEEYACALPNNCTFLVDTYDTLDGVRHAVEAGKRLRERGHEMIGVRIDSGDLAWLSRNARRILDEGGFPDAVIMASNELDEHVIASLKDQAARIDAWGVGTRLATGWDQPALGGVYKLSAIRQPGGEWQPKLKVTDQVSKISTPGLQGVRRFSSDGHFSGDMVYDLEHPPKGEATMIDPLDPTKHKSFATGAEFEELLVPVFRNGESVYDVPSLDEVRERAARELDHVDPATRRFLNPHTYPVGLERGLHELRTALILRARESAD